MEKPVAWILWWTFGGLMGGTSFLKLLNAPIAQALYGSMPIGFQYCIFSFTVIWLALNCLIWYQKLRKHIIENDEAEMILKDKKELKKPQHTKP